MPRKPKSEVIPPPARFVAPLKTPGDVTMERKRLYRAAGRISIDEAAKLSYVLTTIRADLEADQPPEIKEINGLHVDTVIVNGVPSGEFLAPEEIDRLKSQFIEQPPPHIAGGVPMLKLYDRNDVDR